MTTPTKLNKNRIADVMVIRKAEERDLPVLTDILNQGIRWGRATAYLHELKAEERRSWLAEHAEIPYAIFVMEDKDDIIGYLSISPYRKGREALAHVAEISYFVLFAYHRKGVAGALMNHALTYCRTSGIYTLLAFLYATNEPSIRFLEKYGFRRWGLFPGIIRRKKQKIDQVVYGLNIKD
ncbi:MAG: GNAT family N-acetyltransferase [bacterium]